MTSKKITLKELSKKLDVSVSTVSKALSDSPEISDSTKRKIQEVAKLLNYQPNTIAQQLKSGKTNTIGVIIPSIQNNFFVQVLDGIEKVLKASNYNIIISTTQESIKKEAKLLNTLSNGVVDAFIVAVSEETQTLKDFSHFKNLKTTEKPVVMFDRVIKDISCDKVIVDDHDAVFETTKKLIDNGKTNIALVSTINNLSVGTSRTKGYLKAIEKHLGNNSKPLVIEANTNNIDFQIDKLFADEVFDAVITLDEDTSLAVFKRARQHGTSIPKDLALVGFLNEKMAAHLHPEFTTINQHGINIGEHAAELVLERLKNKEKPVRSVTVKATISQRATT